MARTLPLPCKPSKIPVWDAPQGAGTGCADAPSFSHKCIMHNNEVYEKTLVHRFLMSDVEDPEIYAAGPLWEWENSDRGTWCKEHALPNSLEFNIYADPATYGYRVTIAGHFRKEDLVYYYLKWPQTT